MPNNPKIIPPPEGKLVPLGHVVLQSCPLTEEEGKMWLTMIANVLPSEVFTLYSWLPIQPGPTN